MTPRGIRNNNPGNIRFGKSVWLGSVKGSDLSFVTFSEMRYGVRAMAMLLLHYQKAYGDDTIRKLINRWAPPVENDTGSYVNHVALACDISPDAKIDLIHGVLDNVVCAIIMHENGTINGIAPSDFTNGIDMALGVYRAATVTKT
jgi:hypothetical protein